MRLDVKVVPETTTVRELREKYPAGAAQRNAAIALARLARASPAHMALLRERGGLDVLMARHTESRTSASVK